MDDAIFTGFYRDHGQWTYDEFVIGLAHLCCSGYLGPKGQSIFLVGEFTMSQLAHYFTGIQEGNTAHMSFSQLPEPLQQALAGRYDN